MREGVIFGAVAQLLGRAPYFLVGDGPTPSLTVGLLPPSV